MPAAWLLCRPWILFDDFGILQGMLSMKDSRLWLTLGCSLQVEKYLGETLNKQYRVLHPGRQDLQYEQSAPQGNMNAVATVVREAPAV